MSTRTLDVLCWALAGATVLPLLWLLWTGLVFVYAGTYPELVGERAAIASMLGVFAGGGLGFVIIELRARERRQ